jgi:hypothetical protein
MADPKVAGTRRVPSAPKRQRGMCVEAGGNTALLFRPVSTSSMWPRASRQVSSHALRAWIGRMCPKVAGTRRVPSASVPQSSSPHAECRPPLCLKVAGTRRVPSAPKRQRGMCVEERITTQPERLKQESPRALPAGLPRGFLVFPFGGRTLRYTPRPCFSGDQPTLRSTKGEIKGIR